MAHFPRLQAPRRILNELRLRRRSDTVAVDIDATVGFFAQLNWCLYILAYCEQHRLNPRVRFLSAQYSNVPNHDWFHDFFEEKPEPHTSRQSALQGHTSPLSIKHIHETRFADLYGASMSIEWAHRLFSTYYIVKPSIASYIDDFVAGEFSNDGMIGLHFRGTDKRMEAEPVTWPQCLKSVMKLAEDRPSVKKVFVSSDDPSFVEWFTRESAGTLSIIVHPDEERSRDAQAVHTNCSGDGHRKGFEALVNSLLLSRCTALIRTASFLSGWSSIFNPLLPITLLNEPYPPFRWFPDRELIHRSDNRYR